MPLAAPTESYWRVETQWEDLAIVKEEPLRVGAQ